MARKSSSQKPKEQQPEVSTAASGVVVIEAVTSKRVSNKMSDVKSIIEYDVDLEEAEAPVPLPKGDYVGVVRGAEIKTSNKGNEYVNVTFFINADQYPADYTDGNPDGAILSYGRLSPENSVKARWGIKKFCEAIGTTMGRKLDLNDWLDKSATLTVENSEYDGVMQANIKKVGTA